MSDLFSFHTSKYTPIALALETGLQNLGKWYRTLDKSDMYFISLVLDPCVKMAYFSKHWGAEYLRKGMKRLEQVVSLKTTFIVSTN